MSESIDYAERYRDEMESLNDQRGKRGGGFAPPNGVYVVTLTAFKLTEITDKKTQLPCDLLSPRFKIAEVLEVVGAGDEFDDSTVVGKEFFGDTMCTYPDRRFTLGDAFTLAEAISGDAVEDFAEACEICSAEATDDQSALIEVRVTRKTDKKDPSKEYVNTYINGAHDAEEEKDD